MFDDGEHFEDDEFGHCPECGSENIQHADSYRDDLLVCDDCGNCFEETDAFD